MSGTSSNKIVFKLWPCLFTHVVGIERATNLASECAPECVRARALRPASPGPPGTTAPPARRGPGRRPAPPRRPPSPPSPPPRTPRRLLIGRWPFASILSARSSFRRLESHTARATASAMLRRRPSVKGDPARAEMPAERAAKSASAKSAPRSARPTARAAFPAEARLAPSRSASASRERSSGEACAMSAASAASASPTARVSARAAATRPRPPPPSRRPPARGPPASPAILASRHSRYLPGSARTSRAASTKRRALASCPGPVLTEYSHSGVRTVTTAVLLSIVRIDFDQLLGSTDTFLQNGSLHFRVDPEHLAEPYGLALALDAVGIEPERLEHSRSAGRSPARLRASARFRPRVSRASRNDRSARATRPR